MPLLEDYDDEVNRINDSYEYITYTISLPSGRTNYREDVIEHYRYVGMTEDAAKACRADVHNVTTVPAVYAEVRRSGDAGMYEVVVSEVTYGTWSILGEETP
jgi:uncharacterized protein YqiB (DUF1249 family)